MGGKIIQMAQDNHMFQESVSQELWGIAAGVNLLAGAITDYGSSKSKDESLGLSFVLSAVADRVGALESGLDDSMLDDDQRLFLVRANESLSFLSKAIGDAYYIHGTGSLASFHGAAHLLRQLVPLLNGMAGSIDDKESDLLQSAS